MSQVLLLNASYEPLHICSWRRAVVLLLKGKAVLVESQEANGHGPRFAKPSVIRLVYYVKIPHKEIPLNRRNVLYRDHYTCQYCGKKTDLTIDHVLPRSRGGKDTWDNMVTACLRCNVVKGCQTPSEAGMPLRVEPGKPFNFMLFEFGKKQTVGKERYHHWHKYLAMEFN